MTRKGKFAVMFVLCALFLAGMTIRPLEKGTPWYIPINIICFLSLVGAFLISLNLAGNGKR
jgi:hypothetical protein